MLMSAGLGAYLKELRELQKLRPVDVIRELSTRLNKNIDDSRLWRAESGVAWPEGEFLTALLDILGANLKDVAWLQRHPEAPASKGQDLARSWLRRLGKLLAVENDAEELTFLVERAKSMTEDELVQAIELYDSLRGDPLSLARWLSYGQGLSDARDDDDPTQ